MKRFTGYAACGGGLLLSASQVFTLEASPAVFLVGLIVAFWGGAALEAHREEKA